MRQASLKQQKVSHLHLINNPVNQVFQLAFQAIHNFMSSMDDLPFPAAGMRCKPYHKRFNFLSMDTAADALDAHTLAVHTGTFSRFDVQHILLQFVFKEIADPHVQGCRQVL